MTVRILRGDCLEKLRELPDESVHCCVTSPPYYGLRDYGHAGQIGLEPTLDAYLAKMVEVFREVRRVLRSDGTLWLNIGDSYSGSGKGGGGSYGPERKQWGESNANSGALPIHRGQSLLPGREFIEPMDCNAIKPKDLMGVPWRLAFALQQPWERPLCIKSEVDRAWMAALMDGEGCIGVRRYDSHSNGLGEARCQDGFVPYVSVGNNDRELLDRCVAITGYGTVGVKDRPDVDSRGIKSRRTYYGWRLDGNKAMDVIRAIYPYLIAKRRQAVICHNLDLSNKNGKALRGNGVLPASEQERREYMKALVNACNQRQPVTMPDWMVDVKREVEPGWYLRSEIIWAKKSAMPESVRDRPTKSHEHIFLLAKSERYFYDQLAASEPVTESTVARVQQESWDEQEGSDRVPGKTNGPMKAVVKRSGNKERKDAVGHPAGPPHANLSALSNHHQEYATRNWRDVWSLGPEPFKEAHFATFPTEIPRRAIVAGTSEKGCCPSCGAPWVRATERAGRPEVQDSAIDRFGNGAAGVHRKVGGQYQKWLDENPLVTTGWSPSCKCYDDRYRADYPAPRKARKREQRERWNGRWKRLRRRPGLESWPTTAALVIDPFLGSGTTALVADRLQRDCIGIELNPQYAAMAERRIRAASPLFAEVV